jgi:hypothetical protein
MSLDKKKLGEEELKRALLMMKYDSRKTLSENTNDLILEQINCPNAYNASIINQKAFDIRDLIEYIDTTGFRMFNLEGRCKEIYDTIKDLSQHNFYNDLEKTCENSLKRFKEEYLTTGNVFFTNNSIEEQIQEILDDYVADVSVEAANYLRSTLKLIAENENKLAGGTDQVDPQENQVSQNAKKCGWLKTDGSADVEGYRNSNWKCPKSGKSDGGTVKNKYIACKGTKDDPFRKGCYEANIQGPLHQVQTCIGVVSDGKFWTKTESELINKTRKSTFTTDDVNTICNIKPNPETPPKTNPFRGWTSVEPEGGETTNNQRQAEG